MNIFDIFLFQKNKKNIYDRCILKNIKERKKIYDERERSQVTVEKERKKSIKISKILVRLFDR